MILAKQFAQFMAAVYEGRIRPDSPQWNQLRNAFMSGALCGDDAGAHTDELMEYLGIAKTRAIATEKGCYSGPSEGSDA